MTGKGQTFRGGGGSYGMQPGGMGGYPPITTQPIGSPQMSINPQSGGWGMQPGQYPPVTTMPIGSPPLGSIGGDTQPTPPTLPPLPTDQAPAAAPAAPMPDQQQPAPAAPAVSAPPAARGSLGLTSNMTNPSAYSGPMQRMALLRSLGKFYR